MSADDARAALAAALRRAYRQEGWDSPIAQTDAILDAMPNWRLVPADAVPVDAERLADALRELGGLDPDDDARHDFGDFPGPLQRVTEHAAAILAALAPAPSEP